MICSRCRKKDAEIFLKQIAGNKVAQSAFCGNCAKEAVLGPAGAPALLLEILAGLGARPESYASCGLRFSQFRRTGLLGCAGCYDSFRAQLAPLIKRIHGADRHRGKGGGAQELSALRAELEAALSREAFEAAAVLRERIRRLEG